MAETLGRTCRTLGQARDYLDKGQAVSARALIGKARADLDGSRRRLSEIREALGRLLSGGPQERGRREIAEAWRLLAEMRELTQFNENEKKGD